jgi:hypothetical protein
MPVLITVFKRLLRHAFKTADIMLLHYLPIKSGLAINNSDEEENYKGNDVWNELAEQVLLHGKTVDIRLTK